MMCCVFYGSMKGVNKFGYGNLLSFGMEKQKRFATIREGVNSLEAIGTTTHICLGVMMQDILFFV